MLESAIYDLDTDRRISREKERSIRSYLWQNMAKKDFDLFKRNDFDNSNEHLVKLKRDYYSLIFFGKNQRLKVRKMDKKN